MYPVMEAKLVMRCSANSLPFLHASLNLAVRRGFMRCRVAGEGLRVNAVMTKPVEENLNGIRDSWFDRLAIHHLSKSVQETTG